MTLDEWLGFNDSDDEENNDEDNVSYCDVCEHGSDYPDCMLYCPYDDD